METKTCKSCLLELPATYSKLGTNGAKLYVDDKARLWKGNQCPSCQASRRKEQRATKTDLGQKVINALNKVLESESEALESSTSNDSDQS